MKMKASLTRAIVLVAAAALGAVSCSVEGVKVPTPSGPSELGLSLELTATPDIISQDGVSTSTLNILARGPNGLPQGGVPMRVDIMVPADNGLVVADYGTLSDRWPTTASNGRATVTYKAPPQPAPTVTDDTTITLRVTPIGSNYGGSVPRVIEVKLVRPGVIRPPTRMEPRFTFSPSNPREHDDIFFDASTSLDPDGHIVAYSWSWGDGTSGDGKQDSHSYDFAGTYRVVLTVTDQYGTSVSSPPTSIVIGTSANPVARFSVSPTNPTVGINVSFNAVASTATPPRVIVNYSWDFGDGTFKEGMVVTHDYDLPGSYTVILTVTDDAGRKGVTTLTLTVNDLSSPNAQFTVSPTNPAVGTCVVFNASTSTVPAGRTIVSYKWNFGDNTGEQFGQVTSHAFTAPGTYTVVLTVTDNLGKQGVRSATVSVAAGAGPGCSTSLGDGQLGDFR